MSSSGRLARTLAPPCLLWSRFADRLAAWAIACGLLGTAVPTMGQTAIRLPDGTEYRLLAATAGTNRVNHESFYFKLLRDLLPNQWAGKLPAPLVLGARAMDDDRDFVWISLVRTKGAGSIPHVAALDQEDFRMPESDAREDFGGSDVTGFRLSAFPRRQKNFRVTVVDDAGEELGFVTVANPFFREYPEWRPEALPATRTNGPVALTLAELEIRPVLWGYHVSPKWRIASADPRWSQAKLEPYGFKVMDATGNESGVQALSPSERAWRIHTWIHRTRPEDFEPGERHRLAEIPVPGPGQVVPFRTRTNLQGVQLDFLCLSGPGQVAVMNVVSGADAGERPEIKVDADPHESASNVGPSPPSAWRVASCSSSPLPGNVTSAGAWDRFEWYDHPEGRKMHQEWRSTGTFLLIRASGMGERDALLVQVRMHDGRTLAAPFPPARFMTFGTGPDAVRMFPLSVDVPAGETRLSVDVMVSKPLPFDFFVAPPPAPAKRRP